ncbi:MAG: hypothetical protein ACYC23_00450 [Limisphaerales bacterium]
MFASGHSRSDSARPVGAAWMAWLLAIGALGGLEFVEAATVHSRSGQFIVKSPYVTGPSLGQMIATTNRATIELQPDPLAVSAERIKQHLLRVLDLPDRWQGKIHLSIQPRLPADSEPVFSATRFGEGWQYVVQLPGRMERLALVRTILKPLLAELSNRNPGPYQAELPLWLAEGLAAELLSSTGPDLVLETNALLGRTGDGWGELMPTIRQQKFWEGQRSLKAFFDTRAPLTFNDLNLPSPEMLAGADHGVFTASSHLLLLGLLELPEGRGRLVRLLEIAPRSLNWQTAFLGAFQELFPNLAEVEKWWAVTTVRFTGRHEGNTWSRMETLEYLRRALTVPVSERRVTDLAPRQGEASLQRVINEMSLQKQSRVLATRIGQLQIIQSRAAPDLLDLVTDYVECLQTYAEQRSRVGTSPLGKGHAPINARFVVRNALGRLDALDRQRFAALQAEINGISVPDNSGSGSGPQAAPAGSRR